MAELQKTSLVKYFASLSLKLGVSFVGGCSAYRWNCCWSWQASPGVPSLDTAGVRERARGGPGGGRLIWKMSVGSFSDSDTMHHPGYHRRLEANWGSYRILVAPWNIMHTFFTAMKTDHWTEARANIQLWAQRAVGLKLPMLDHTWPCLDSAWQCLLTTPQTSLIGSREFTTDIAGRMNGTKLLARPTLTTLMSII